MSEPSRIRNLALRPGTYGIAYLVSIPLFAFVYWYFSLIGEEGGPVDALYFSAITITTLGYGDILPENSFGKLTSAAESVLGVVIIGLYLNSLSQSYAEKAARNERKLELERYRKSERAKIHGRFSILQGHFQRHFLLLSQLGVNPNDWKGASYNTDSGNIERAKLAVQVSELEFRSLERCFLPTMMMTEKTSDSWMAAFLESETELLAEIRALIRHVDLRLFPELRGISFGFIGDLTVSRHTTNLREYVEMANQEKMKFIKETISNWDEPIKLKGGNIFDLFVLFYLTMQVRTPLLMQLYDMMSEAGEDDTSAL